MSGDGTGYALAKAHAELSEVHAELTEEKQRHERRRRAEEELSEEMRRQLALTSANLANLKSEESIGKLALRKALHDLSLMRQDLSLQVDENESLVARVSELSSGYERVVRLQEETRGKLEELQAKYAKEVKAAKELARRVESLEEQKIVWEQQRAFWESVRHTGRLEQ